MLWPQTAKQNLPLFEHIRSVTAYFLFPSWHSLLRTIITGMPPHQPA